MAQGQPTRVKKRKKSVLKRARQSEDRAEINRANRTRVRTMMRRMRSAITAGDVTAAGNLLRLTVSAIDRAITKGGDSVARKDKATLYLPCDALRFLQADLLRPLRSIVVFVRDRRLVFGRGHDYKG